LDINTIGQIQDLMAKRASISHELRTYDDGILGFALRSDWCSENGSRAMNDTKKQGVDVSCLNIII
jgi:hypothetical protein